MKRLIDIIDERIQSIDDLLSKLPALKYSNGYRIYRKQNKNSYYYYLRHTDDNKRNSDYIGVHYSDNAKELYREVAFTEAVKVLKMNKQSLIDFKKTYIPIIHNINSTTILLIAVITNSLILQIWLHNSIQILRRTIINYDQFPILIGLCTDTLDGFIQKSLLECRYDDGEIHHFIT